MKRQIKFNSQEQQELQGAAERNQAAPALEFASVEEMLRHDALHTPVPPHIAGRLAESLAQLPSARRSWWRRLWGGL